MKAVAAFGSCVVILMIAVVTEANQGTTYIRWGRTVCPQGSNVIYQGVMANTHSDRDWSSGGTNYLCILESPTYATHGSGHVNWDARVYVVNYDFYDNNDNSFDPFSHKNNAGGSLGHGVAPCVACFTPRGPLITIASTNSCPRGWTKEYDGYVASSGDRHAKSEHICLDEAPETRGTRTSEWKHGVANIQPVVAHCLPGSFPTCGTKIKDGWELTCAVCTKG